MKIALALLFISFSAQAELHSFAYIPATAFLNDPDPIGPEGIRSSRMVCAAEPGMQDDSEDADWIAANTGASGSFNNVNFPDDSRLYCKALHTALNAAGGVVMGLFSNEIVVVSGEPPEALPRDYIMGPPGSLQEVSNE